MTLAIMTTSPRWSLIQVTSVLTPSEVAGAPWSMPEPWGWGLLDDGVGTRHSSFSEICVICVITVTGTAHSMQRSAKRCNSDETG